MLKLSTAFTLSIKALKLNAFCPTNQLCKWIMCSQATVCQSHLPKSVLEYLYTGLFQHGCHGYSLFSSCEFNFNVNPLIWYYSTQCVAHNTIAKLNLIYLHLSLFPILFFFPSLPLFYLDNGRVPSDILECVRLSLLLSTGLILQHCGDVRGWRRSSLIVTGLGQCVRCMLQCPHYFPHYKRTELDISITRNFISGIINKSKIPVSFLLFQVQLRRDSEGYILY